MADRRTITMNWDGLAAVDDDDDDRFFESLDRISSATPFDLAFSSGSDDDDEDDVSRVSFASAISSAKSVISRRSNYDVWKEEPGSIAERRRRLLQGMGLSGNKELIRLASAGFTARAVSKKVPPARAAAAIDWQQLEPPRRSLLKPKPKPIVLVRSRSDGDIGVFSPETERLQNFFGPISKQRLTRTRSTTTPPPSRARQCRLNVNSTRIAPRERERNSGGGAALSSSSPPPPSSSLLSNRSHQFGAYFLIKNLDTGNEFIVKEFDQHGMWNRLRDLHTGKQLTMEEFEKSLGYYSPAVMDLMRRQTRTMPSAIVEGGRSSSSIGDSQRKVTATNSSLSRSFRNSMRRGTALLKNIKGVANSVSEQASEMLERKSSRRHFNSMDHLPALESKPSSKNSSNSSSTWTKVRQLGKSHKELTALHMCQEIQAHEGSIWSIQFSSDARYLASAGEDRVIHVWEVQECEIMSTRLTDDWGCSAHSSPIHPAFAVGSPDRHTMTEAASLLADKKKKGKSSSWRKGNPIPDYVHVPETVFALSEKPTCTFQGHQDDILDLSWSKSQLLLSSSMDKTVRLWDMETKSCLKLFAHNDYVTCIQFNPIDDDYFISGSLDAKVRMWNVPNRQVTDWADLHDMVTAASYTPDGQAALIGSHKGHCRMYNTTGCNLRQINQFDIQTKRKSHAKKKITGFQFPPGGKSSEVLISSADSRIRIYDSSVLVHKFRGFRNSSSQISASFTPSGKHVICASEDSHVYVWKRDEVVGKGKGFINTRSHENFHCRDVSVAVPWPGTVKGEPPPLVVHSKRHSKRSTAPAPPFRPRSACSANCSPENNKKAHQSCHHHHHHHLPPLAGKSHTASEEDLAARIDSGIGFNFESFRSSSGSARYSDSPLIPASERVHSSSSSWLAPLDGGRGDHGSQVATAWGMVIVTAGLGGEIRAYQNFGLPVRVGRQANLFNATS